MGKEGERTKEIYGEVKVVLALHSYFGKMFLIIQNLEKACILFLNCA